MNPLSSTSERDWQAAIDPALYQRLVRPLEQPGVIRFDLARQIWGRSQKLHDRLPLLQQLQRRQPPEKVTGGTVPIVYAQASWVENPAGNPKGTKAPREVQGEGGGVVEGVQPNDRAVPAPASGSSSSPVIQAKFAPGAGPSAMNMGAAAALPLAGTPDSQGDPTAHGHLPALVTPETVAMADRPLPLVNPEPAIAPPPLQKITPNLAPLTLPHPATEIPSVPVDSPTFASPAPPPDLPLVQVAPTAIVTPESEPFKIQNSKFKTSALPLVVPHSLEAGGFRGSLRLPQSRLENPPLQPVLPRVQVDQGVRSPSGARSFPATPLRQAASEDIPGARSPSPTVTSASSPSSLRSNSPTDRFAERTTSPSPPLPTPHSPLPPCLTSIP